MIGPSLFTETVQLLGRTVTGRNDRGEDITAWDGPDSPAWLEQAGSSEDDDRRESTQYRMLCYLPDDADLTWYSRIKWRGQTWQIVGQPNYQPGGFVLDAYQVVTIARAEG